MSGANLQVHVGADTEGFLGEMRRMDQQFAQVTRGVNEHGFALNKAQRALEFFAVQATGTNRVLGILGTTLSDFAAGGLVTSAVLLGIGAIAKAYDLLTEGSQHAREEADKLSKSLLAEADAADHASQSGLSASVKQAAATLAAAQRQTGAGFGSILLQGMSPYSTNALTVADSTARANGLTQLSRAYQQAVNDLGVFIGKENDADAAARKTFADHTAAMAKIAQDDLIRYNEFMKASYGRIGGYNEAPRGPLASRHAIEDAGAAAQDLYLKGQALSMSIFKDSTPQLSMPNISINDGLTKEQIKQREKLGVLIDDSNKNANNLHDAIWGAAAASANLIVGALNIGGGGKGSQLGGAIGSTAGFAIGFAIGHSPIGGVIGSTAGNLIGSAIGGLFDHHKKSIDKNTQALTALTAALELNTPSGYKVAAARYGASDPAGSGDTYDTVADAARQRRTRGGAQPLMLVGV